MGSCGLLGTWRGGTGGGAGLGGSGGSDRWHRLFWLELSVQPRRGTRGEGVAGGVLGELGDETLLNSQWKRLTGEGWLAGLGKLMKISGGRWGTGGGVSGSGSRGGGGGGLGRGPSVEEERMEGEGEWEEGPLKTETRGCTRECGGGSRGGMAGGLSSLEPI